MASVFTKKGRAAFWARIKLGPGEWTSVPTNETDRDAALEYARAYQEEVDRKAALAVAEGSLNAWVTRWMIKRQQKVHDWKKERGRLAKHVLPTLGHVQVKDITAKMIADLIHSLRFEAKKANRTVRSVYTVLKAVMRDAALEGLIATSPCVLKEAELGSIVDKNPEWRSGALFTRAEAETMISDRHIPLDRRVTYAFGLLAGLRPGEASALRWRNYDPTCEPLGKLTVALSYSTTNRKVKSTKTEAVRIIPVHPVLAIMLAEWRTGWIVMFGREPGPDDLILPLPPESAARVKREPYRDSNWTLRRWTDIDEKRLGWRHRSVYDTKSTFITLAIEDGADRDTIRDRITHAKARRDAFDGYDRGPHWKATCTELSKLCIRYLATTVRPENMEDASMREQDGSASLNGSGGGFRRLADDRDCTRSPAIVDGESVQTRAPCDHYLELVHETACDRPGGDE